MTTVRSKVIVCMVFEQIGLHKEAGAMGQQLVACLRGSKLWDSERLLGLSKVLQDA
jgi:hypothetical protein